MTRRISPGVNGTDWFDCDMNHEEMPQWCRYCWCQSRHAWDHMSICNCRCHEDVNSRGVYV